MWEGLSGGCRAGFTLKRCSQLASFAIQPVSWDTAAVLLVEDGVPRYAPLPRFNLVPFGRVAARTVVESLVVIYRVGTHQIRRMRRAARSSTSQRRVEPLCARITSLNREVSEGKADVWPRSYFFLPTWATRSGERGRFLGVFARMHRALDGWMLARVPASPARGLHHHAWTSVFQFPYFCSMCGLEKFGIVDQNWLERNLSTLLLSTLVVGTRQQSESIEVALDMESGGLMNRFDIGRSHCL